MERTQTFLMILHFDADGSKPNLRNEDKTFIRRKSEHNYLAYTSTIPFLDTCRIGESEMEWISVKNRKVTTWAPSHVEIALMAELLTYANILNGLKVENRKRLRPKLDVNSEVIEDAKLFREGKIDLDNESLQSNFNSALKNQEDVIIATKDQGFLQGCNYNFKEKKCESVFCILLTMEYLDYFKGLIKPYI